MLFHTHPGAPLPAPEAALPIGKGGCPGPQNFGGEEQDRMV